MLNQKDFSLYKLLVTIVVFYLLQLNCVYGQVATVKSIPNSALSQIEKPEYLLPEKGFYVNEDGDSVYCSQVNGNWSIAECYRLLDRMKNYSDGMMYDTYNAFLGIAEAANAFRSEDLINELIGFSAAGNLWETSLIQSFLYLDEVYCNNNQVREILLKGLQSENNLTRYYSGINLAVLGDWKTAELYLKEAIQFHFIWRLKGNPQAIEFFKRMTEDSTVDNSSRRDAALALKRISRE